MSQNTSDGVNADSGLSKIVDNIGDVREGLVSVLFQMDLEVSNSPFIQTMGSPYFGCILMMLSLLYLLTIF